MASVKIFNPFETQFSYCQNGPNKEKSVVSKILLHKIVKGDMKCYIQIQNMGTNLTLRFFRYSDNNFKLRYLHIQNFNSQRGGILMESEQFK
jgi:hypothetical protein